MNRKLDTTTSIIVFLVAAFSSFDLPLPGRIPAGELLAFVSIPIILRKSIITQNSKSLLIVAIPLALWILGIVVSDLTNGFEADRFSRAIAKPVFCFLWFFFFLGVLSRDHRTILFYPLGMICARLQNYLFPQSISDEYIAKGGYHEVVFGISPIVIAATLFLAIWLYKTSKTLCPIVYASSALILYMLGTARSSVVMTIFVSAILCYLTFQRSKRRRPKKISSVRIASLGILSIFTILILFKLYTYSAERGLLGEYQQEKYNSQSSTIFGKSILGLVTSGRTEVVAAILGIIDKPLNGHGSWTGVTMSGYHEAAVFLTETDSTILERTANSENLGAGHSVFFQAWLENGILAAIALGAIAIITVKEYIRSILYYDSAICIFIIHLGTFFFWAFMFSPFGVNTRTTIGLFLALHIAHKHLLQYFNNKHFLESKRKLLNDKFQIRVNENSICN